MGRIEKNAKRGKNLQPKCVGFHDFKQEKYPLLPQYQFCIVINVLNFPLLGVKFPDWEENFFSDHSLIVDPESSSVELGISTILEV